MIDSEDPIMNVAMPGRASAMSDDHERSSAGDRKERGAGTRKSSNADLEAPVDAAQHELDSLA